MKDSLPLTKLLNRYSLGLISKKDLEGHIFKFILDNYQQFHPYGWDKEDYIDYLCWLYPRISRAIENYQDTGASFDAYIISLVHWGSKEYRALEMDHHVAEYICWKAKALDDAACHEEDDVYSEPEPVFNSVSNPRQILVLLLKSYYYLSPDFLDRISPALNIDKEKLRQLIEKLRMLRLRREEDIRELRERIHSQFYRCIVFEKKLKLTPPNSCRHEKMQRSLARGRKRLESMRKRLAGIKTVASNRQVAQVLESAKGTIDAHLYTVKAKGKKYEDKSVEKD
jgi:hypothetical protein